MARTIPLFFMIMWGCSHKKIIIVSTESHSACYNSNPYFLCRLSDNKVVTNQGEIYSVKLPSEWKNRRIAWGLTYFTGNKKTVTGKNIFYLISDYDSSSCQVVFDTNGNTNFTDDSVKNIKPGNPFFITYHNEQDTQGVFLEKYVFKKNDSDKVAPGFYEHFTQNYYNALPAFFHMQEQRMNFRKALLADHNVITLFDANCNGFYDDESDRVIAGDIAFDIGYKISKNPVKSKPANGSEVLPFPNNTYKLVSVDKYGRWIKLQVLDKVIDTMEKFSAFTYYDVNKNSHIFYADTSRAFSVLYIWGDWCLGCHQQSPLVDKLKDCFGDISSFHAFNFGDKEADRLKYIQQEKLSFKPDYIEKASLTRLNEMVFHVFLL